MPCRAILVLAAAVFLFAHGVTQAQPTAAESRKAALRNRGAGAAPRYFSGVQSGVGYTGMKTRLDAIRRIDIISSRASDRFNSLYRPSPMRMLLDRQSLVIPRSSLGSRMAANRGFTLERKEGIVRPARAGEVNERLNVLGLGEGDTPLESTDTSDTTLGTTYLHSGGFSVDSAGELQRNERFTYQDYLERRIKLQAESAYETGLHHVNLYDPLDSRRTMNSLMTARNYFELYRDVEQDKSKGYFAIGIVSFLNRDYARSFAGMRGGILRVRTVADLDIEKNRMFKDPRYVRDLFDSASTFCSAMGDRTTSGVILSYTAYLYGDMSTAMAAAESLVGTADAELAMAAPLYRKVLAEAAAQGSAPANAAPSTSEESPLDRVTSPAEAAPGTTSAPAGG